MLIQKQEKNNKRKQGIKRSQILLFGSLLVFIGIITLSYGHLKVLKELIYENVRLSLIDTKEEKKEVKKEDDNPIVQETPVQEEKVQQPKVYYNYIGYLEIPKIESLALTAYSNAFTNAFRSLSCKNSWNPILIHSLISSSVFKSFKIYSLKDFDLVIFASPLFKKFMCFFDIFGLF